MLEFIILAAALIGLGAVLRVYWDRIRNWLNNSAADVVEKALGLKARKAMFKAVSVADRVFRVFNNRPVATNISTVFSKMSNDTYEKVQMINNIPAEELGNEYMEEMRTADNVMEMDYRQ